MAPSIYGTIIFLFKFNLAKNHRRGEGQCMTWDAQCISTLMLSDGLLAVYSIGRCAWELVSVCSENIFQCVHKVFWWDTEYWTLIISSTNRLYSPNLIYHLNFPVMIDDLNIEIMNFSAKKWYTWTFEAEYLV